VGSFLAYFEAVIAPATIQLVTVAILRSRKTIKITFGNLYVFNQLLLVGSRGLKAMGLGNFTDFLQLHNSTPCHQDNNSENTFDAVPYYVLLERLDKYSAVIHLFPMAKVKKLFVTI
jgi:hypothetical protein